MFDIFPRTTRAVYGNMNNADSIEALLLDLQNVDATRASESFTELFRRGCLLLELDDAAAAVTFGTSIPNVSRWRRGKTIPPAAALFLKFLRKEIQAKVSAGSLS